MEHKIAGKSRGVALDGLVQSPGFDTVDFSQVRGKHDPLTTDKMNAALNGFQGSLHRADVAVVSGACKLLGKSGERGWGKVKVKVKGGKCKVESGDGVLNHGLHE